MTVPIGLLLLIEGSDRAQTERLRGIFNTLLRYQLGPSKVKPNLKDGV